MCRVRACWSAGEIPTGLLYVDPSAQDLHAAGAVGDLFSSVVGVLDHWRPAPHYFDLTLGAYAKPADVYMPLATSLALSASARLYCCSEE